MATADILAIGLLSGFCRFGISVPYDISVIGFDGLEETNYTTPGLTTIKQPSPGRGETKEYDMDKCVEMLTP